MKKFIMFGLFAVLMVLLISRVLVFAQKATPSPRAPIKIGLLMPLSGNFAFNGEETKNGIELAFEQAGDIAGRKIQIIAEDDEFKPDVGMAKARKLANADKVHLFMGPISSAIGLPLRDFAAAEKIPHVVVMGLSSNDWVTTISRWTKRPWIAGSIIADGLATYLAKEVGAKRIITMNPDYAMGHSMAAFFKETAKMGGGEIVQEIFTPMGTLDFSPYLTSLKKADALIAEYGGGAEAQRVVKQFREYGIKMELAGGGTFQELLDQMGKDAIGAYTASPWFPFIDNPENVAFIKVYKEKYGREPGMWAAGAYSGTLMLIEVLRKIEGDVENKTRFLDAWYDIKPVKTPSGTIGYEKEMEAGIWEVYLCKVVQKEGKMTYEMLKKVTDVKASDVPKLLGLTVKKINY